MNEVQLIIEGNGDSVLLNVSVFSYYEATRILCFSGWHFCCSLVLESHLESS